MARGAFIFSRGGNHDGEYHDDNGQSEQAGHAAGYISQIMCGTRVPSPRMREKLLNVLAPLTFDDLFIIEESNNGSEHG